VANVLRQASGVSLGLHVPCEPRYLDTVRPLSTRIATYLGFAEPDAGRLGESIDAVVRRFMAGSTPDGGDAHVAVTFTVGATAVEIWLRCHASAVDRTNLERDLRHAILPGGALEPIHHAMNGVHIGQEAGVAFCCLTRDLPADAT
jgi:hypothetical protein